MTHELNNTDALNCWNGAGLAASASAHCDFLWGIWLLSSAVQGLCSVHSYLYPHCGTVTLIGMQQTHSGTS